MGRLCIPYMDMMGVYALKFRCLAHEDCKAEGCDKYIGLQGQGVSIYGVTDADSASPVAHITEGELDRLVIKQVFGEPAMGVPGVKSWKPHFPFFFGGFGQVVMWPDGDAAGAELAARVSRDVRNVEVIPMPKGMDVSKYYVTHGAEGLRALMGEEDEE